MNINKLNSDIITKEELRGGMLLLSQPAEGGWNFYVDDRDPARAASLATAWAARFAEQVQAQIAAAGDLNAFIEAGITRNASVPAARSVSMSVYIFVGAVMFLTIGSITVLFFGRPK